MITTVSEAMVRCLEAEGVETIFGYPGATICPFYDALSRSNIRHVLVRTEQNAGHAANGYARMTGKPAVCVVTSGPGATNLITGISTAYMDSIPMVIITGQVVSSLLGSDVFQEVDITGSVEAFIKHSYLIKDPKDIGRIFKEAFYIAGTGRPGPVLIDIPMDVQKMEIDFTYPEKVSIRSYRPSFKGHIGQINKAAAAIAKAKRPLIVAGGGIFISKAEKTLRTFVEKTKIPVVTTLMGIGALQPDDPCALGMIGMHGIRPANYAVGQADVLILCGARVADRTIPNPEALARHKTIIHMDIDPAEIGKNIGVDIPVVGDIRMILSQLTEAACEDGLEIDGSGWDDWWEELHHQQKEYHPDHGDRKNDVNPKLFMRAPYQQRPEDARLVPDVGQNQMWAANEFSVKKGRFLTSGGMGTMGYSLPCAIGAKAACPDRMTVSVCGDGSFQMCFMELATECQHHIPVKTVVFTNNRLGMVREHQRVAWDNNLTAVFLDGSPDFAKLAEAYGIPSARIHLNDQIELAIDSLIHSEGSFLLEVIVDPLESTL